MSGGPCSWHSSMSARDSAAGIGYRGARRETVATVLARALSQRVPRFRGQGLRRGRGIVQIHGRGRLYAATDLVGFLECEHLTSLDLMHVVTPLKVAERDESARLVQ